MTLAGERDGRRSLSEWRFHRDIYAAAPRRGRRPYARAVLPLRWRACMPIPPTTTWWPGRGKDIRCAPYATFGTQELSDHADRGAWRSSGLSDREPRHDRHRRVAGAALALAVEVETFAETIGARCRSASRCRCPMPRWTCWRNSRPTASSQPVRGCAAAPRKKRATVSGSPYIHFGSLTRVPVPAGRSGMTKARSNRPGLCTMGA